MEGFPQPSHEDDHEPLQHAPELIPADAFGPGPDATRWIRLQRSALVDASVRSRRAGGPGTTEPGPGRQRRTREQILDSMKRNQEMRAKRPLLRKIQHELGGLSIAQLTEISSRIDVMKESPDA